MATVSSKYQITLPAEIRKRLHIKAGDEVIFIEENDKFFMVKLDDLMDEVLDSFDDLEETEREFRKGFTLNRQ
jgi:AbrB family looped-hinge helix DNA binding protein